MKKLDFKKIGWILIFVFSPLAWAMAQRVDDALEKNKPDDPYGYQGALLLNKVDIGYRGIWYSVGRLPNNPYVFKYAGGLGTYPSNIYPFSVYAPDVEKTFFCYGGTNDSGNTLYHQVAYYNHRTGKVSKPTIVLDKRTEDAHDNPCISVDKEGYIWMFSNAHGALRSAFVFRSEKPFDIRKFKKIKPVKMQDGKEVPMTNFSYMQIYYDRDQGFLGLFTHYLVQPLKSGKKTCRIASFMTSPDGVHWSEWKDIANIEQGHYQTSAKSGRRIGTAFNFHPDVSMGVGLDYRTNLYYLSTDDFGKTWKTADGKTAELPLTTISNEALVYDYASEGLKVYINDVNFDQNGNPVILYETTNGWEPGPENGPRQWYTAHWNGTAWKISDFTRSDNNYDMGSLYIEKDNTWRVIAPTDPGPQSYNTGGALVMWESKDEGNHWQRIKDMTAGSRYNHAYPRRSENPQKDFYAFWPDGDGRQPSKSRLYFCNKDGEVFQLPAKMKKYEMKPRVVDKAIIGNSPF